MFTFRTNFPLGELQLCFEINHSKCYRRRNCLPTIREETSMKHSKSAGFRSAEKEFQI